MGTNARTRIDVVARVSYLLSCALLFGVAVVLVPAIVPVSLSLRKTTATATTHAFAFAFAFSPIPLPTTNTRTHTGRTTTTAGWNCNWNSNGNLPWELLQAPRLHHHHHHHHHHRQWRIQNPKACSRWLQRTSSLTAATEIEAETEASFSENSGSSSNSTAGTESSSMTSTAMESQPQPQPQPLPIRYNPALLRYRCRISYDGTSFSGFQLQGGRSDADSDGGSQRSGTNRNNAKDKRKDKRKHQKTPPRTIQGELERVLSTRFQRVVRVTGAGRTDGGVHARGQAIHFDLYHNETYTATQRQTPTQAQTLDNNNNNNDNDNHDREREREFDRDLEHTLNRMLPEDIRAWNLGRTTPTAVNANAEGTGTSTAPPGLYNWNAMRTSTAKLYSYRISVGDAMDPTERHHRWQIPWQSIDPSRLERVLKTFEGTHDFVCFAGALEQQQKKTGIVVGTVRTIHRIDLVKESTAGKRGNGNGNAAAQNAGTIATPSCDDYYYRIDVYLDGALYKMVRNIVGTAVDACRDWIDDEWLEDLLQNPGDLGYTRKDNPCMPAPPNGLTLERVFYPDDDVF